MTKEETLAKHAEHLDRADENLARVGAEIVKLRACTARANEAHTRVRSIREQMALATENRAALQALEAQFHVDARQALAEGARAQRAAHEAMAAVDFELGQAQALETELNPEPSLQDQNRYARKLDGRLTAGERREALERRIASGAIPAARADAARQLLEREMADEAKKASRRRKLLNQTLRALNA